MSVVAAHEYAEAVTDPLTETEQGWTEPGAGANNEIADICEGNFPSSWVDLFVRDPSAAAVGQHHRQVLHVGRDALQLAGAGSCRPSSRARGPIRGRTTVTVTGQNFIAGATNVSFGPTPATSVTVAGFQPR